VNLTRTVSDTLFRRPNLFLTLLLAPPLLWLGIAFLGSLFVFLFHAFFSIDEFSGFIKYELTLSTFAEFTARYARGKWKALFYILVMLPLWSSYLVKVYAWKLILAKEGIISWLAGQLHLTWALDALLAIPVIGGPSLSISFLGTFIVFVYVWLPFMILPTQAALERVPVNLIDASSDLGATPAQTFRNVIFPLALPGIIAGSIFTFSLTLGDYIIPQIIGNSSYFLGQTVYTLQGTAGNIPLAAAFTVVPIVIMGIYLAIAKRMGAFDAL
jgi:putative spermidine/putrescine transport system permease protein